MRCCCDSFNNVSRFTDDFFGAYFIRWHAMVVYIWVSVLWKKRCDWLIISPSSNESNGTVRWQNAHAHIGCQQKNQYNSRTCTANRILVNFLELLQNKLHLPTAAGAVAQAGRMHECTNRGVQRGAHWAVHACLFSQAMAEDVCTAHLPWSQPVIPAQDKPFCAWI